MYRYDTVLTVAKVGHTLYRRSLGGQGRVNGLASFFFDKLQNRTLPLSHPPEFIVLLLSFLEALLELADLFLRFPHGCKSNLLRLQPCILFFHKLLLQLLHGGVQLFLHLHICPSQRNFRKVSKLQNKSSTRYNLTFEYKRDSPQPFYIQLDIIINAFFKQQKFHD
jgi:hypothetical protein